MSCSARAPPGSEARSLEEPPEKLSDIRQNTAVRLARASARALGAPGAAFLRRLWVEGDIK